MTRDDVLTKLQGAFDTVFLDEVRVTPELTADDVAEWTSLVHVSLIVAVEDLFDIRFRVGEVETTRNVGELADLIVLHVQSR